MLGDKTRGLVLAVLAFGLCGGASAQATDDGIDLAIKKDAIRQVKAIAYAKLKPEYRELVEYHFNKYLRFNRGWKQENGELTYRGGSVDLRMRNGKLWSYEIDADWQYDVDLDPDLDEKLIPVENAIGWIIDSVYGEQPEGWTYEFDSFRGQSNQTRNYFAVGGLVRGVYHGIKTDWSAIDAAVDRATGCITRMESPFRAFQAINDEDWKPVKSIDQAALLTGVLRAVLSLRPNHRITHWSDVEFEIATINAWKSSQDKVLELSDRHKRRAEDKQMIMQFTCLVRTEAEGFVVIGDAVTGEVISLTAGRWGTDSLSSSDSWNRGFGSGGGGGFGGQFYDSRIWDKPLPPEKLAWSVLGTGATSQGLLELLEEPRDFNLARRAAVQSFSRQALHLFGNEDFSIAGAIVDREVRWYRPSEALRKALVEAELKLPTFGEPKGEVRL
jgi:hypothetical protein